MTREEGHRLKPGDLVQVDPEADEYLGGCIGILSSHRPTHGLVEFRGSGRDFNHSLVAWEFLEPVGRLHWFDDLPAVVMTASAN
jgi:hypothetical protein